MRSYGRILASVLPWSMAGVGYQSSVLNDPRRWDADYSGTFDMPMTEADACRINAAQAKRDRKAAKRLRDAQMARGGCDA